MHAGPKTAAAAAYDDHFRLEDLGEPSERMSDVPGQFTGSAWTPSAWASAPTPVGEVAVEDGGIPVRLIRVDGVGESTDPSGCSATTYAAASTLATTSTASNWRAKPAACRITSGGCFGVTLDYDVAIRLVICRGFDSTPSDAIGRLRSHQPCAGSRARPSGGHHRRITL